MAARKRVPASGPRGTPQWILREFRAMGRGIQMSTADIAKRLAKVRGHAYHRNSIYNALRMLTRRGELRMVRTGRQKVYRLQEAGRSVPSSAPSVAPRATARPVAAPAPSVAPSAVPAPTSGPHKLAHGELLVLSVSESHVLSGTNQRGRLVLKRHRIPR